MHHGGWVGGLLGIKPGSHWYETRVVTTGPDDGAAIFPVWFFKAFPKKQTNTLLVFPVYPLTPQYGKLWPWDSGCLPTVFPHSALRVVPYTNVFLSLQKWDFALKFVVTLENT